MSAKDPSIPQGFPDVLKDLNREVLRAQPSDIYQFCANHFAKKLELQRKNLSSLAVQAPGGQEAVDRVMSETEQSCGEASGVTNNDHSHADDDFSSSSDEESDEEEQEEAPAPPPNYANRGRRTSVSAESMAPTAAEANTAKIVIPKTPEQRSRIEDSIRNNFLFKSLDEDQYSDVIDAMSEKKYGTDEQVIRQGAVGDYFYVTESGTLDVFVARNPDNPPVKVASYGPQSSFGELALMYNAPRAATITTTSPCVLWALDRITFRRILMDSTSRKRRYYESLLEDLPLLCSLEPYERHKIADALESVVYEDGEVVVRQGDVGENFYFIEQGEARVTVTDEEGTLYELKGLGKGGYFGELALLHDKPRVATVSAKGRLKVATLGKKAFVRLLGPFIDIIKRNSANYESIQKRVDAQRSGTVQGPGTSVGAVAQLQSQA